MINLGEKNNNKPGPRLLRSSLSTEVKLNHLMKPRAKAEEASLISPAREREKKEAREAAETRRK